MRKHFCIIALILIFCLAVSSHAVAEDWSGSMPYTTEQAYGNCWLSHSGRSVTYSGTSTSGSIEDQISVAVSLLEYNNGVWSQVGPGVSDLNYNSDYAYASGSYTVSGGHYYKVSAIHTSRTGSYSHTETSETSAVWIS